MILYIVWSFILFMIWITELHVITWVHCRDTYNRLQRLTGLVRMQHKNIGTIVRVSAQIIWKAFCVAFFQYINRNMRQIDKNTYELSYVVSGRLYKMLIKAKRGPRTVIQIIDEEGTDVTDHIHTYMGPMENFHGHKEITPSHLNRGALTFFLDDGREMTFEKDSKIDI